MAAMLGVALADNLLLLAVFWELTSVASFLLIGYWHTRADARQGARMALAVTATGGLAMLAGFLLIGSIAGTYEISALAGMHDRIVRRSALSGRRSCSSCSARSPRARSSRSISGCPRRWRRRRRCRRTCTRRRW